MVEGNIIKVLDKGHVQYLDHMGSCLSIVNAARVSFDKESEWDWWCPACEKMRLPDVFGYICEVNPQYECVVEKRLSPRDTSLIYFLARGCSSKELDALVEEFAQGDDRKQIKEMLLDFRRTGAHWTPFGQVNIQLRIKMPIFVARQMMRSNVGIVWNEVSRRYVDSKPEVYKPDTWRGRPDGSIKQGSGSEVKYRRVYRDGFNCENYALVEYNNMINSGVAPEQARIVLPQSTYTEVVGNFTLAALARVCALREGKTAQWEIQQFSKAMGEIARTYFPVSWAALMEG